MISAHKEGQGGQDFLILNEETNIKCRLSDFPFTPGQAISSPFKVRYSILVYVSSSTKHKVHHTMIFPDYK